MATAKTTARKSTNPFEQVSNVSSEAMRENVDRSLAAMAEASSFGKQNVEAFVASAAAAQKGFEALSARSVAFSKQALENHVTAAKALMTSKSVQEFVEKQNAYAKSSFEAYVAELSGFSELASGLAKEAIQPINERLSAVGEIVQVGAVR
jgi:phasin family protein